MIENLASPWRNSGSANGPPRHCAERDSQSPPRRVEWHGSDAVCLALQKFSVAASGGSLEQPPRCAHPPAPTWRILPFARRQPPEYGIAVSPLPNEECGHQAGWPPPGFAPRLIPPRPREALRAQAIQFNKELTAAPLDAVRSGARGSRARIALLDLEAKVPGSGRVLAASSYITSSRKRSTERRARPSQPHVDPILPALCPVKGCIASQRRDRAWHNQRGAHPCLRDDPLGMQDLSLGSQLTHLTLKLGHGAS